MIMRIALLLACLAAPVWAGDLMPAIPAATGDPHPEGNDYMRRNHMEMMKHDRDLTLRQGDRDIGASLGQCFDCHAVEVVGEPVGYDNEQHFCRTCHDYAAVKVDCFMCHTSKPATDIHRTMATADEPNSIAAYLTRVEGAEQ